MTPAPLCFDATGTLIEMTSSVGSVYAEIARSFGVEVSGGRLEEAFREVMRHAPARGIQGDSSFVRRESELGWWSERIRQTFEAADAGGRFEDFPAFSRALFDTFRQGHRWRPRQGVIEALERLAREGHEMLVISNFDHRLPEILQELDLERFFITVILPWEIGAGKPDRRLFEVAAERLGCPLAELVYIGDDSAETLAEIEAHGLSVLDIHSLTSFSMLPEWLASPATLSSTRACDPS